MLEVTPYGLCRKAAWDEFIASAKNSVFLFFRDYLEYHSDRFTDASLMVFDGHTLVSVMPANLDGDVLVSHGGLTFGGILSDQKMTAHRMLEVFSAVIAHAKAMGARRMVYKPPPHIYQRYPAEEDLYALFINGARLVRRDLSSAIAIQSPQRIGFSGLRKRWIKRAKQSDLDVHRDVDFAPFMDLLERRLRERYGKLPVHTAQEMELLATRFPNNIKMFGAYERGSLVGGVLVYENATVAHAQYITSNDRGREIGALDAVMDYLINDYYAEKQYFDFGISTENEGRYLNVGLVTNKESYGARAITYDFYELDLTDAS